MATIKDLLGKMIEKINDVPKKLSDLEIDMEIGGEQVQFDWNQNDETAKDYVKNRTHYTQGETLLEYGALEFMDMDGIYGHAMPQALAIQDGCKVTVTWDGVVYQVIATQQVENVIEFGNRMVFGEEDTGEPFMFSVLAAEGLTLIGAFDTATSHNVGIVAEKATKIEKKYLPDTIPYLQDGYLPMRYFIPDADDVFKGVIAAGGTYSTLANPYPNKLTLNLTLDEYNAMFNGDVYLPKYVMISNNIAHVRTTNMENCIDVNWSELSIYATNNAKTAGVHVVAYEAKIHEDAENPGTIVSEYAMIQVVNTPLT